MTKPTFVLVGADKGGVGKTTVARTLIDYFTRNDVPMRAFDTEWPRGTLKRFHPDLTEIVDVGQVHNQVRIFDEPEQTKKNVTIIDIRAGLLSPTLQTLSDVGFLEMANHGHFHLAILHILGPSVASLEEISETVKMVGNAEYILVKNFINDTRFFEWQPETYNGFFGAANGTREIIIPRLNELACESVELAQIPYSQFVSDRTATGEVASYSFVLRGYVRHWLTQVWAEYDRVNLAGILDYRSADSPARDTPQRQDDNDTSGDEISSSGAAQ